MLHEEILEVLGKAQKTNSLIELMYQYHHDIKAPLSIIDGVVSNDLYDRDKKKDSRFIPSYAGKARSEPL